MERWNLHEQGKNGLAFRVPKNGARPLLNEIIGIAAMTTIIHQFKDYLYQVGYGEGTQNTLPALVSEFLDHQGITDISWIEQQKVRSFYEWLEIRPCKRRPGALSEMMIQHYVYALKTFFGWLEVTEQTSYNPISGMKFKKAKQNTRQPLSIPEINKLFEAARSLKETALLHLFYSAGLRRSEAEALNTGDIHFKERLLYVREGKGAKRRVVPLTQRVAEELESYYLNDRCVASAKKVKDLDAFMLNRIGIRMKGDQYIRLLGKIVSRTEITGEVTLHHLRHSIATHLLQSGMHMEYVRDFLGHQFLESTQIYAKASAEQLKLL